MRKMLLIGAVCLVAIIFWTGLVFAQTAKPAAVKLLKLPSGEEVFDISGDWDAIIENTASWARFGTFPSVVKITYEGSSFTGIRLKDNPPPSWGKAGEKCIQGEVDKNGIKKLEIITPDGNKLPAVWKVSEDGNKMDIDAFDSVLPTRSQLVRYTLIRK
jgi:hypothetical protein